MSEISDLKDALETKGRAWEEMKTTVASLQAEVKAGVPLEPTIAAKVDKLNAAIDKQDEIKTQYETRAAKLENKIQALETEIARKDFSGGGISELDKAKAQHKVAYEKWFRRGGESQEALVRDLQIKAEISTLSDPDGGLLVAPPEVDSEIARVAGTMSAMRRLATVRSIGTDTYKKLVNQGGSSSGWVAEKGTRSETDTSTVAEIVINMKEVYAMPKATQISLDDSSLDIPSWLADESSIEFAEEEGVAWINGNGVEKPHGIGAYTMVANASYAWGKIGYLTSGHASLINDPDKIEDLTYALKTIYLSGASFLTNRNTVGKIRQLKDGDGNSIWQPAMTLGAPNVLFGYPVNTDDNIDAVAANKYPIFFGNFKRAYLILDRMGIRILRNPYTSPGNVYFYMTKRVGGGIIMYEAIKAMKISV